MKLYFLPLFLFISHTSSCQIIIESKVLDIKTKTPLSYVNVMVENNYIGASSDKKGLFKLKLNDSIKNGNIIFSAIGYKTIKLPFQYFKNSKEVFLTKDLIELDKVVIDSKYNTEDIKLNVFKKKKCNLLYSTNPFIKGKSLWIPYRKNEPTIEGLYFPNELTKSTYLKKVVVFMKSFTEESVFRIHIYNIDKNGFPNKSIINTPIQKMKRGDHLLTINLKDYDIEMPKRGVFIGIELLLVKQNISYVKNQENEKAKLISPFLYYIPTPLSKNKSYIFYRFTKGSWKKIINYQPRFNTKKDYKKIYKPAITLILE